MAPAASQIPEKQRTRLTSRLKVMAFDSETDNTELNSV
jgi:hypothetical protein